MTPRDKTFAAFAVRNFRIFVAGQSISLVGSWTETVAQGLLVLELTHSGVVLGFAAAARYLPVLLLTPYAGLLVDRHSKRSILLITATLLGALSIVSAVLVITGWIQIWHIFVIALAFGCLTALDNPARQAFIPEMVDRTLIRNAVTVNSIFVNVGRAVGPVVAAVVVASWGIAWCFAINAISFAFVLVALTVIRVSELRPVPAVKRLHGQVRAGLAYALTVPEIRAPIAMMVLIGTFTYEFEVSLPLLAEQTLNAGAIGYSWLIGAFGLGSVVGGINCLRRPGTGTRRLRRACVLYAAAMTGAGFAPTLELAVPLLFVTGLASITFLTTGNSTIQLAARPEMRGRVTALWSTAFVGSTPIGASIIGLIGATDVRIAMWVGALACLAAIAVGTVLLTHPRSTHPAGLELQP